MKYRYVVLLGLLTFILSSTILQIFRINDALPNLCIILSIILTVLYSKEHGYIFAVTVGALSDVFLGKVLSANLLIYVLIIFMISRMSNVMFKGNFLTPIFLTVLSTFVYHISFYILMFFMQSTIPLELLLVKIVTEVIYNSVLCLLIYSKVFKRINGYKLGDFNA